MAPPTQPVIDRATPVLRATPMLWWRATVFHPLAALLAATAILLVDNESAGQLPAAAWLLAASVGAIMTFVAVVQRKHLVWFDRAGLIILSVVCSVGWLSAAFFFALELTNSGYSTYPEWRAIQ